MRATLAYTAARLAVFVAAAGVLYLVGARGWLLLGLAVLVSGIFSLVLLSRQRDAMSGAITSRIASWRQRLEEGASREDDDSDA